jgi:hypothetical protein
MNNEELLRLIKRWGVSVGRDDAVKRLVAADIKPSLAEKLITGKYDKELGFNRAITILRELEQDGFLLAGKKRAS